MASVWRIIPIVPKKYDIRGVKSQLLKVMQEEARTVKGLYRKTTKTWRNKPKFKSKIRRLRESYYMEVWYDTDTKAGQIYEYVDLGTRSHMIRPRRARYLRFRVGGKAKTKPRKITSYRGAAGKHWRSASVVRHPGSKARLFTATIAERRKPKLDAAFKRAMKKAIKNVER